MATRPSQHLALRPRLLSRVEYVRDARCVPGMLEAVDPDRLPPLPRVVGARGVVRGSLTSREKARREKGEGKGKGKGRRLKAKDELRLFPSPLTLPSPFSPFTLEAAAASLTLPLPRQARCAVLRRGSIPGTAGLRTVPTRCSHARLHGRFPPEARSPKIVR